MIRVMPLARHRDFGILPHICTLDAEAVRSEILQRVVDELTNLPGSRDRTGWQSIAWLSNVQSAEVITNPTTWKYFITGEYRRHRPYQMDIRSFCPAGIFPVGGQQLASPQFRGLMTASLQGFEFAMMAMGGECFKDTTYDIRGKILDSRGENRATTEVILWWKITSAFAEWFSMAKKMPFQAIRDTYPGLPLTGEQQRSQMVRGPEIWAELLARVLGGVDLCDSPLGGHNEACFMATQLPLISFGKVAVVTPPKKTKMEEGGGKMEGGSVSQVSKKEESSRTQDSKDLKDQVCMTHLKGLLGIKNTIGKESKCGNKGCRRLHANPEVDTQAGVLSRIHINPWEDKTAEESLRKLIKQVFKKV